MAESALKQELGPKKYYQKIEKANKEYDLYKAGKRDPKTGVFYHDINFSKPGAKKLGASLGSIECDCGNALSISVTTVMVQCSLCKSCYSIKFNRDDNTLEVKKNG